MFVTTNTQAKGYFYEWDLMIEGSGCNSIFCLSAATKETSS